MIEVYDDLISPPYQNFIEGKLHNDFEWKYFETLCYPKHLNIGSDGSGFVGIILPSLKTDLINLLLPLAYAGSYRYNGEENVEGIHRIRAVMLIKNQYEGAGVPHTDIEEPHTTLIYYVNDSDGPTYFYDKDMNIIKEVHPKKGRIIAFPGEILHAGCAPKKSKHRYLININLAKAARMSIQ